MRNENNDQFYIGGRSNQNLSQDSNLAKYGKMNMEFTSQKPISTTNIRYGDSISNFQEEL